MMRYTLFLTLFWIAGCSDEVPQLPQARIDAVYSDVEREQLNNAVYALDRRCYNVFSKPAEYSGLSARLIDAAPEEQKSYGWTVVAEVSLTLGSHRDFGKASKNYCSFRIAPGSRPGINGKSVCMEDACRMQPLEKGAAWGLYSSN